LKKPQVILAFGDNNVEVITSNCMNLPATMRGVVLSGLGESLNEVIVPVPTPGTGQVLIKVAACGVCRTDLEISFCIKGQSCSTASNTTTASGK